MAVYEVLPFTNLTDSDIMDTLNASSRKINMWSKFKPVVSPKLFHSYEEWTGGGFRGFDGQCGLTITLYDPEGFKDAAKDGGGAWTYNKPSGGTTEPIRWGDYRGYCYTAYNPIGSVAASGIISNGVLSFAIDSAITGESDTNLTLDDIRIGGEQGVPLSEYYFGIFLWNDYNEYFYTSKTKIGSDSDLNVSIPAPAEGDYSFIPFLSSTIQSGNDVEATIISCNKKVQGITVRASSTLKSVQPTGTWNVSNTQVEVGAFLHNTGTSSTTFTGVTVELWENNLETGVEQKVRTASYSGEISVSANSTEMVEFQQPIKYERKSNCDYYLLGYSNETTESTYGEIDEMSLEGYSLSRLKI